MILSKYMLGDKVSHSIVKTVPQQLVQEVATSIPLALLFSAARYPWIGILCKSACWNKGLHKGLHKSEFTVLRGGGGGVTPSRL